MTTPEAQHRNRPASAAVTIAIIFAVIWIVQFVNVGTGYLLDADFGIRAHVLSVVAAAEALLAGGAA